jgi:hypothetical protein
MGDNSQEEVSRILFNRVAKKKQLSTEKGLFYNSNSFSKTKGSTPKAQQTSLIARNGLVLFSSVLFSRGKYRSNYHPKINSKKKTPNQSQKP